MEGPAGRGPRPPRRSGWGSFGVCLAAVLVASARAAPAQESCVAGGRADPDSAGGRADSASAGRWYRGSLHTHSLWSDGDEFPELVFDGYRRNGYHFVALTDHNVLPGETRWMAVAEAEGRGASMERYHRAMGDDWIETRIRDSVPEFRLRPPGEFASRFEEPGRFLIVPGEEISDAFEGVQVHLNGLNLAGTILPQGGAGVGEVLSNDVAAVREHGRETGREVYAQANHPNFEWAIDAGDLAGLEGVDPEGPASFEVYNGHWTISSRMNANAPVEGETERAWTPPVAP